MGARSAQQSKLHEPERRRLQLSQERLRRFDRSSARVETVDKRRIGNVPSAVAANLLVVIAPAIAVLAIAPGGGPVFVFASMSVAVALSAATACIGSALWMRRPTCGQLVFSDLMLWGWVRRVRTERRLAAVRHVHMLDGSCEPQRSPARHLADLKRLSRLIDAQDPYTRGHSLRVTRHAEGIARAMRLPTCDVAKLRTGAALHDIGKIHTPQAILQKPGRLTDDEFAVIKRHPGDGADMLSALRDPAIAAMIRHHHERLDGSGYPDALVGENIPLGARIIAVADTFDAMTSNRSYRGAFRHKKALDVLADEAGTRLDAAAVSAFNAYYSGKKLAAWSAVITTAVSRLFVGLGSHQQVVTAAAPPLAKALPAIAATAILASPIASPAPDRQGSGAHREMSDAGQIADTASLRPQESGIESIPDSVRRRAHREPEPTSRSSRPVKSNSKRTQRETGMAFRNPTPGMRAGPHRSTPRLALSLDRKQHEILDRGPAPARPWSESLKQLPKVERPSVERAANESPATALGLAEPATRSPAADARAIEVTPSAAALAEGR